MSKFLKSTLRRQTEKALQLQRQEIQQEKTEGLSNKNNPKNYMVLNEKERYYFMLGISVYMMSKDESNQISLDNLNEIIEKLAKLCPENLSSKTDAITYHINLPIKQRIDDDETFLGKLQDDVRACGLLVKDSSDRVFKFGHKSFLEYLAAEFAQRSFSDNDNKNDENYCYHSCK